MLSASTVVDAAGCQGPRFSRAPPSGRPSRVSASTTDPRTTVHEPVAARLSTLDRFLPVWIGLAMVAGLLLGPARARASATRCRAVEVDGVSLPIALGPARDDVPGAGQGPLRPARHGHRRPAAAGRARWCSTGWSGPALMFALAWIFLPDLPAYRTGLIIVGLARCIAMVIIWNDLACGDREAAAVLVALNSVFQVVAFAGLGWFYLSVLPGWLGLRADRHRRLDRGTSPRSVLIFLGIPLLAGFLSRRLGEKRRGRDWYESDVPPAHRPVGALRPALHHRHPVRPAGRRHHLAARSTSPGSPCRCSSTSP